MMRPVGIGILHLATQAPLESMSGACGESGVCARQPAVIQEPWVRTTGTGSPCPVVCTHPETLSEPIWTWSQSPLTYPHPWTIYEAHWNRDFTLSEPAVTWDPLVRSIVTVNLLPVSQSHPGTLTEACEDWKAVPSDTSIHWSQWRLWGLGVYSQWLTFIQKPTVRPSGIRKQSSWPVHTQKA